MIIKLYFALQVTHANVNGNPIPHGTVPPPRRDCTPDDWTPSDNQVQFDSDVGEEDQWAHGDMGC